MNAKTKSRISAILIALIILAIPPLIYFGVSLNLIFDKNFYLGELEKNSVYDNFEDKLLPENLSAQVISYFWGGSSQPPGIAPFGPAEQSHLLDVKKVITNLRSTTYLLIILLVLLKLISLLLFRKAFLKHLGLITLISGVSSILLGLVLVVLALNFQWSFIQFHHLLFPQGNWMFPSESALIRLFPAETFIDFFKVILIRGFVLSVLLTCFGLILLNFRKKSERNISKKTNRRPHGQA